MVLIIYKTLGIWLFQASFNPHAYKPLLSWAMWGGNFAHGCVAFIHCFETGGPQEASAIYA